MDSLGFLLFLLILGSGIFNNRKKRQKHQQDNQSESDSVDMNSTEREPYDWSEPGQQSRPGPKAKPKTASKGELSWEAMEEYYGIKMERKDETPAANNQKTVLETKPASNQERRSVDRKSTVDELRDILITTSQETKNQESKARERNTRDTSLDKVITAISQVSQAKTVQSMPQGTVWEPTQLTGTRKRSQALPPGGLKAGIKWSLILQAPKAKQQGAYRR